MKGKQVNLNSPKKKRPSKTDADTSSNNASPKTYRGNASQPSLQQEWNDTSWWKNPLLPPIQILNSNATTSSQSITSKVSTTSAVAMYQLNSIWDDDKVGTINMKLVRNKQDICGAIILSSSYNATRMISHVLKWQKGGLGACTGINPKERDKQYSDFHNQKAEQKERENKGRISWWLLQSINMMLLLQCLQSIKINKRGPHLLACPCPQARVACRCLLMLEWIRKRWWMFESLIKLCWKWVLQTVSILQKKKRAVESNHFWKILNVTNVFGLGFTIPSRRGELLFIN